MTTTGRGSQAGARTNSAKAVRERILEELKRLAKKGVETDAALDCPQLVAYIRSRIQRLDIDTGGVTSPELVKLVLSSLVKEERSKPNPWDLVLAAAEFIDLPDPKLKDPPRPPYEKDTDYENRCRRAGLFLETEQGEKVTTAKRAKASIPRCMKALLDVTGRFLTDASEVRKIFDATTLEDDTSEFLSPDSVNNGGPADNAPKADSKPASPHTTDDSASTSADEETSGTKGATRFRHFPWLSEEAAERVIRYIFMPRRYRHLASSAATPAAIRATTLRMAAILLTLTALLSVGMLITAPLRSWLYEDVSEWFLDEMQQQLDRGILWPFAGSIATGLVGVTVLVALMWVGAKRLSKHERKEASPR